MGSDIESGLVNGGLAPAAAKIVANAIANLSSEQLRLGRQLQDATPAKQLRMISPDSRKYVFTNLDHTKEDPFARSLGSKRGQFESPDRNHPYQDSQPASASGTISTPAVKEGDFIAVSSTSKDSVKQATISLRINDFGGRHARINHSTKAVDSVPFSVEVDQEQFVEAKFEERPNGTVLRITLKNLTLLTLPDSSQFWGWPA